MEAQFNSPVFPRIAGNKNTSFLKIIAIACMLIDHAGVVFFKNAAEMRLIGRIAFPLYAWCIVVGGEYTRNIWLYALRLLIVGLISQPLFMWGLNHQWNELNIFATLLLGLMGIAGSRERKWGSQFWAPALVIALSCMIQVDYGWEGVLLILCLWACRKQKSALIAVMICFCLFWGQGTFNIGSLFGIRIPSSYSFLPKGYKLTSAITKIQFSAILALPLMLIPMNFSFRLPKWIAYSVYPAHLLILGIFRHWDQITAFLAGLL